MTNHIPVLVIGAGPVGLVTAALLTHYDIPVRIIDKKPSSTKTSNAVAIHARTLELLNILGLSEKFVNEGWRVNSIELYTSLEHLASFCFKFIESKYDFVCCIPQSLTEQYLIEHLASKGVQVERGIDVNSIENEITQTVAVKTNKETIIANWVVACDGYHSTARQALDIPYEGADMGFKFIMIDSPIVWEYPLDSMYAGTSKELGVALFPMLHSVRIIAEVSNSPTFNHAEPDENNFMKIVKRCLPGDMKIDKPLWSSKFWIHERLAKNYVQGHVLLAGDAAHAHSPAGGQGMNTGMQDAINLCWKLALIIKGDAKEGLLCSYEEERRPVAQEVLANTSRLSNIALSKNKALIKIRNILMPLVTKPHFIQKKVASFISETAINYEASSFVSGHSVHGLKPGDRLSYFGELDDKHLLIDFSGDAHAGLNNSLVTVINAKQFDLPDKLKDIKEGYCLLRPDCYIGYLGNDLTEVEQYLQKIHGN